MAWLAIVVGVSIGIGLLRGGRLTNLAHIRLRGWWLLFVGAGLTALAFLVPEDRSWSTEVGVGLILLSFVPLFLVAVLNREEPGLWLAALGILLNFTVIAFNGGMPVVPEAATLVGAESPSEVLDVKHRVATDESRLLFLADVIPIKPIRQVISIGDFLLALGIGQFLVDRMRRPVTWFRRQQMSTPGSAANV